MPILLPIASGKGGVGKSVIAANLALQLSRLGKTVILADMDWGGANTHTLLGLKNSHAGIGDFVTNKDIHLENLIVPLPDPHLFFLPGDGLIPGTANMEFFRKIRLIKELKQLTADYVVIDLGAGTHFNTIDIFLSCSIGFVVTSPEPTAILNAYSFIKTALFRLLIASLPVKHPGREIIRNFFQHKNDSHSAVENANNPDESEIQSLYTRMNLIDPEATKRLQTLHAAFCPRILVNMGKELQELALGGRLRQVCHRHLTVSIEYIGFIPWDDEVRKSIMTRSLINRNSPISPFSKAMSTLALKISTSHFETQKPPIEDFSDLQTLAEETAFS